jgi:hypothetical protein|tara:strand:- start:1196 stop:1435 length:240 start_codon:yes stop_codon:yes gene_type:complete
MHIKRLIHGRFSKYVLSLLLGIGLATLFRKACNSRNCLIFRAPTIDKIKNQVFKYNEKCYTFKEEAQSCDPSKKIVDIA